MPNGDGKSKRTYDRATLIRTLQKMAWEHPDIIRRTVLWEARELLGGKHGEIFDKIAAERDRQDQKWGYPQLNTFSEWAGILAEECGECCAELNELNFGRGKPERLFAEAVQVAAVAVSIIEQFQTALVVTERWADMRDAGKEEDK